MAVTKKELIEWLNGLDDDDLVGIDDGGLTLVVEDKEDYYEIGGIPEQSEDERFESDEAAAAGLTVRQGEMRKQYMSDKTALDQIAALLNCAEWTADTASQVAAIVRLTGRTVNDLPADILKHWGEEE